MKLKICIWMNMPSHHQSSLFREISKLNDIDLKVIYYDKLSKTRKELGWEDKSLLTNEKYIHTIDEISTILPDWEDRIHIVPGFSSAFLKKLINLLVSEKIRWIHWSERAGVNLAKLVNFNNTLFNILYPMFLLFKGYKKYAQQVNNYALGALAIGSLAESDFRKWGIKKKINFLPYSLDPLIKLNDDSNDSNKTITFMYIGQLSKRKGIDTLINAFSMVLKKATIKLKLILIGKDTTDNKYIDLAKSLGILEKVEFTGIINTERINQYLIKADVFILPSNFDGWGAVLNEAASLSKALISTNKTGASFSLIKDGENGFIINNRNTQELVNAMRYYINNPKQILIHGKKSLELFNDITPKNSAILLRNSINEFLEDDNETTN